ncbi:hypothetical protein [Spirosoma jeollabukense]
MTQSKKNVNILLEQYVFEVAARFIDEASPEDQTRLMNLLNTIEKSSRITNSQLESSKEMGANRRPNLQ